jgi:hypothetical protein
MGGAGKHSPGITDLVRQLLAALGAAAAQYETAGAAGHALHEAVLFRALAFLGLIGTFWHMLSLYSNIC